MIKKVIGALLVLIIAWVGNYFKNTPPDDINSIKVANWNVQNLFDMERQGGEYKEFVPNRHNWKERIYKKKIKNIAEVICDLDADVIGFEEIESDIALRDLQNFLNRAGCKYPYRAITSSKDTPVHTALLSKIKIKSKRDIKVGRGLYRSILEVTLNTNPPLKIFVNHWSSKRHPESKRLVYAKTLKKRLNRLPKGSEYIVLGDFNSNYDEFETMPDRLNNTDGKTGINHILGTVISDELVRLSYLKDHPNTKKLYNLWLELPESSRWSYRVYRKKYTLDSILIPPTLVNRKGWEYIEDSFKVFKPKYLFTKRGAIFKWQYKHSKHLGKGYSDHLPIYAKFKIVSKDKKEGTQEESEMEKLPKYNLLNPPKDQTETLNPKIATIDDLIKGSISMPVILKDVVVIFKRGKSAIVKSVNGGSGILIYGGAKDLREGGVYDLKVFKTKSYYSLPEIIDMKILKAKDEIDISPFIKKFEPSMMEGDYPTSEVVKDIEGVLEGKWLIVDGKKIMVYFRGKRNRPKSGDKLIIKIAQIGYYKGQKELIVWSKKDYSILD